MKARICAGALVAAAACGGSDSGPPSLTGLISYEDRAQQSSGRLDTALTLMPARAITLSLINDTDGAASTTTCQPVAVGAAVAVRATGADGLRGRWRSAWTGVAAIAAIVTDARATRTARMEVDKGNRTAPGRRRSRAHRPAERAPRHTT